MYGQAQTIITAVTKHALLLGTEDGIAEFLFALRSVLGTNVLDFFSFLGSSICKDYHGLYLKCVSQVR